MQPNNARQRWRVQWILPNIHTCMKEPLEYNIRHRPQEEVCDPKTGEVLSWDQETQKLVERFGGTMIWMWLMEAYQAV